MMSDINKKRYNNIEYQENHQNINNQKNLIDEKSNIEETKEKSDYNSILKNISNNNGIVLNFNDSTREQTFFTTFDLNRVADKLKIIEFIKIVEYNNNYNGFIKEINNGYYLTCSSDNELKIYDIFFNLVMHIKGNKESVFDACERVYHDDKDKNKIQIIASAKKELNIFKVDLEQKNCTIRSFDVGGIHYIDLFNQNTRQNEVVEKAFFGGF